MSHDPHLDKPVLSLIPNNIISIIDIGCGWGLWGCMLRVQKGYKGLLNGLDIYKPYIDNLKKYNLYDNLFNMDIMEFVDKFSTCGYDLILCCELIEHLKRKDGLKLINLFRHYNKVIITTPLITSKTLKENEGNWTGNDKMFHISGYTPKDFEGYKIIMVDVTYIPRQLKPLLKIREKLTGKSYSDKNIIAYRGI